MILSAVRKIADGVYFVVDYKSFTNILTPYDPTVANQTISQGYETLQLADFSELREEDKVKGKENAETRPDVLGS